eukprot:1158991-Pelagomonas_calceolata.AAC.6
MKVHTKAYQKPSAAILGLGAHKSLMSYKCTQKRPECLMQLSLKLCKLAVVKTCLVGALCIPGPPQTLACNCVAVPHSASCEDASLGG